MNTGLLITVSYALAVLLTLDPDTGMLPDSTGSARQGDLSVLNECSDLAESIMVDALSYLGTPYVYGGTGPDGFDCSGLICRVFDENGIQLPRTVTGMEEMGEAVTLEELLPGDLLIFLNPKHVGLYLGGGEFIHSSSYQGRGVVITELSQASYARRYSSARRVIPSEL